MGVPTTIKASQVLRPLGVWILTGYAFIFAGLVPLVFGLGLFGFASSELGFGFLELGFSVILSLGVAVASFGAWRGFRAAKNAMITLVALHYAAIAVNNLFFLLANEGDAGSSSQLIGRVLRGVLYPAVYLWYFRRSAPREFYGES